MGDKFIVFLDHPKLGPIIENKVKNHMSKKLGRFCFAFLPHYRHHRMTHYQHRDKERKKDFYFCLIIIIIG